MDMIPEGCRQPHYMPLDRFAKLQDCKMASVFEDQSNGTLYYEYAANEVKLRNLADQNSSTRGDIVYSPSRDLMQPWPNGYEYQRYTEQKYIPHNDHIYDSLRMDYPYLCTEFIDPKLFYDKDSKRSKSRNSRSSTRSRSKSTDKKRKKTPQVSELKCNKSEPQFFGRASENVSRMSTRSRNSSAPAYDKNKYNVQNDYYAHHALQLNPYGADFVTSNRIPWQQHPRNFYRAFQTIYPVSPLDSGLSSQSVASSPSLEAEPLHPRRIPECGSPVPLVSVPRNQCSCSTNSCSDYNVTSPPIRNDSGRSSPWTHSAFSRLNAVTDIRSADAPRSLPTLAKTVTLSTHDFDQRRYSISGIIVSPREKEYNSLPIPEHGTVKYARMPVSKNHRSRYENFNDKDFFSFATEQPSEHFRRHKTEHLKHVDIETVIPKELINQCNTTIVNHDQREENPEVESPVNVIHSISPTDISSPVSNKSDSDSRKSDQQSSKSAEKAICELEEMYNKLNLQDSDLLDRAERRDLPTQHQMLNRNYSNISRSKSDSFYEIFGPNFCNPYKTHQRAPPRRRSGVPDLIADDMAMRKMQKPMLKPIPPNENASYMLYSSHFTPSLPSPNDIWMANRPDVEQDDFSFRRYFHMSSGKVEEPQPPFGIPLHPNQPQSVYSDYLHIVPSSIPQNLCHPRGNPDVVRDDMAFRSLRKDDPERAMYDSYALFYRKVR